MKRSLLLIIVVALLLTAAVLSIKPVIIHIAQNQIAKVFIDGEVSIGSCQGALWNGLSLQDVRVRREGIYDFHIAEVRADYSLASLLGGMISDIAVQEAHLRVDLPGKNISDLRSYLALGAGGPSWTIRTLILSDIQVDARSKDLEVNARGSAEIALADLTVRAIDATVSSLRSRKFLLEEGTLTGEPGSKDKALRIRNVQYDKVRIEELKGLIRQEKEGVFLDGLSARVFRGRVEGRAVLNIKEEAGYRTDLSFVAMDLEDLIRAFKLGEKFQMSGLIGGRVVAEGQGMEIRILDGNLSTAQAGGLLTIKDERLLENIAQRSGQSLDILVESFRNYHYNTGTVTLSLVEKDLLLSMALGGEAGKRNLDIVLHDFQSRKDGL